MLGGQSTFGGGGYQVCSVVPDHGMGPVCQPTMVRELSWGYWLSPFHQVVGVQELTASVGLSFYYLYVLMFMKLAFDQCNG
jgi:hypothetical protein